MKSLIILTIILVFSIFFGTVACNDSGELEPTTTPVPSPGPTSSPEPATPTPTAIDWAAIATRINQLSADSGLTLYEVGQLFDDIVKISFEGNCTEFASLIDAEPDFVLQGKPQIDPQGICTIWFRVLLE